MSTNIFIIFGLFVFVLLIAYIFYFVIKKSKKPSQENIKIINAKKPVKDDLDYLLTQAKNAKSTNELSELVIKFVNTQTLGLKIDSNLSEDVKKKLSFISILCANKNADAKIISFLNMELSKKNPSFKKEIDLYENMGLARRRMK